MMETPTADATTELIVSLLRHLNYSTMQIEMILRMYPLPPTDALVETLRQTKAKFEDPEFPLHDAALISVWRSKVFALLSAHSALYLADNRSTADKVASTLPGLASEVTHTRTVAEPCILSANITKNVVFRLPQTADLSDLRLKLRNKLRDILLRLNTPPAQIDDLLKLEPTPREQLLLNLQNIETFILTLGTSSGELQIDSCRAWAVLLWGIDADANVIPPLQAPTRLLPVKVPEPVSKEPEPVSKAPAPVSKEPDAVPKDPNAVAKGALAGILDILTLVPSVKSLGDTDGLTQLLAFIRNMDPLLRRLQQMETAKPSTIEGTLFEAITGKLPSTMMVAFSGERTLEQLRTVMQREVDNKPSGSRMVHKKKNPWSQETTTTPKETTTTPKTPEPNLADGQVAPVTLSWPFNVPPRLQCFHCNEEGHLSADCPTRVMPTYTAEAIYEVLAGAFNNQPLLDTPTRLYQLTDLMNVLARARSLLAPYQGDAILLGALYVVVDSRLSDYLRQEFGRTHRTTERRTLGNLAAFLQRHATELAKEENRNKKKPVFFPAGTGRKCFCTYCKMSGHRQDDCAERKACLCTRCFAFGHATETCSNRQVRVPLEHFKRM